jgi:hypothetical protein
MTKIIKPIYVKINVSDIADLSGCQIVIDFVFDPKPETAVKYRGVHWHKNAQKWRAKINFKKTAFHLGLFDSQEDAYAAYKTAAKKLDELKDEPSKSAVISILKEMRL